MKEIKKEVKVFEYKDYIIYIFDEDFGYGCYIQNVGYGIISLMFGLPKNQNTLEETIEIVKSNLEEQIEIYKRLYEDEV